MHKTYQKVLVVLFLAGIAFSLTVSSVFAQQDSGAQQAAQQPIFDEYSRATVLEVIKKGEEKSLNISSIVQQVRIRIESGKENGLEVTAQNSITTNNTTWFELKEGDRVVIVKALNIDGASYYVTDMYRLSSIWVIGILFVFFVIVFGRMKGVCSLLGLGVSIAILALYIVPRIYRGDDPLMVSIIGGGIILFCSLYLAHGFTKRTTIALVSTLITLGIAVGFSVVFVSFAQLFGTGTEDALYLQFGSTGAINLRGLLLAGIIIGTLGVLDDITTSQAAAVDELHQANASLSRWELYRRGLSVGKEHIASLVNTLALAYAGASLPLFLIFAVNTALPVWVLLNSDSIAEEIIRTFVGSVALIIAVPLTTFFAAMYFGKKQST